MSHRRLAAVLLVLVALVSTSCNSEDNSIPAIERQDRIIATANSTDDPAQIRITWFPAPCEAFNGVLVDVDEQYANLTVKVTVDVESCPESSITETVVDLGEPLGDREIWDRAFGNTVALDV